VYQDAGFKSEAIRVRSGQKVTGRSHACHFDEKRVSLIFTGAVYSVKISCKVFNTVVRVFGDTAPNFLTSRVLSTVRI